jgi:hypothetical protein
MLVASSLLEDEVTRLCGPRSERQPHRTRQERLGDDLEGIAIDGWLAPGQPSRLSPGKAARICLSRSNARV